ncbi:MAG TPA: hypothetical protein VK611_21530 [Acidimicrobiales bacterium]|nr:hypothetical protein [Acidimicrobiales bacterium]
MTATLVVVLFALFCCAMALWVILADRNWQPPTRTGRLDPLAGMTDAALDLVRQANRRQPGSTR